MPARTERNVRVTYSVMVVWLYSCIYVFSYSSMGISSGYISESRR